MTPVTCSRITRFWIIALLASAGGCNAVMPGQVKIETAGGLYQSAQFTYRVDNSTAVATLANAGSARPVGPIPAGSIGTLSIQYPHPDDKPGYALVELVIEEPSGSPSSNWWQGLKRSAHKSLPGVKWQDGVKEAMALDIPRQELDSIVAQLAKNGYFSAQSRQGNGQILLSANMDGARVAKSWRAVPELNVLVQRTRAQGSLISYMRPPQSLAPAPPQTALAYRDLILREQRAAAQPGSYPLHPTVGTAPAQPSSAPFDPIHFVSQPPAAPAQPFVHASPAGYQAEPSAPAPVIERLPPVTDETFWR